MRLGIFAAAFAGALALAGGAMAQAFDGMWEGVLEAGGQRLRLELDIRTQGGQLGAQLKSLDQGDTTLQSSAVKVENGEIGLLFMDVGGEFKGRLSEDGRSLAGAWNQGRSLPVTFTRKAPAAR